MRNAIRYYYELEVEDLTYEDSRYFFQDYCLVPLAHEIPLSLYEQLKAWGYPLYDIVPNREHEMITTLDQKPYILLKTHPVMPIRLQVLEQFQIPMFKSAILPWNELWMNKVDYYERYMETVTDEKLLSSFFYYEGMTENAISFYQVIKKEHPLYIAHNRMTDDFDYWNPLNYTVDYRVRDLAEYIKIKFFEGKFQMEDLLLYFYRTHFEPQDYLLFYARMLYPSYYFDCYDTIVKGGDNHCLDRYLEKVDAYEDFLKDLYYLFQKVVFLPKIDWLIDK